jgi:hypothetical protein
MQDQLTTLPEIQKMQQPCHAFSNGSFLDPKTRCDITVTQVSPNKAVNRAQQTYALPIATHLRTFFSWRSAGCVARLATFDPEETHYSMLPRRKTSVWSELLTEQCWTASWTISTFWVKPFAADKTTVRANTQS